MSIYIKKKQAEFKNKKKKKSSTKAKQKKMSRAIENFSVKAVNMDDPVPKNPSQDLEAPTLRPPSPPQQNS